MAEDMGGRARGRSTAQTLMDSKSKAAIENIKAENEDLLGDELDEMESAARDSVDRAGDDDEVQNPVTAGKAKV